MRTNSLEIKREVLEKRLAKLSEEYIVINQQLDQTLNAGDRTRIHRQVSDVFQQMEQVEAELKQLESSENSSNRRYLELEKNLPKIDFAKAIKRVDRILGQFGKEGGAALFLLQNSYSMAGRLCVSEIRERLNKSTGYFKHYPFEFSPERQLDEFGLLDGLAGYFKIESFIDKEEYAQAIVDKICQSIQSGSVVLFELKKWDELSRPEQVLSWFLENFWTLLINRLPTIAQTCHRVRLVVIIVSDTELSSECLMLYKDWMKNKCDKHEIVELQLQKWTSQDIEKWLGLYSGLPASRIDSKAKKIYKASINGIPALVCNALMEEFK